MKLTVRQKYDVRKIASDFELSNKLTKLFFDVKKTAFDFKRSNALTRLFDCQIAAFDCDVIKCALTIIFCKNLLQLIDCNVICNEAKVLHSMLMSLNIVAIANVKNAAFNFE